MKITTEKTSDSRVILTFQAEPPDVEQALERAYKRLAQRVTVPGFRKGKVPKSMLDLYLGRDALQEEAVHRVLVPELTEKAIREQNIDLIAQPDVEVTSMDPVTWKATIPLRPAVELGDYKSIRVERPKAEVTEEQINRVLEELRFSYTPWQPADRPVHLGDLVTIEVVGTEDGKSILDQKGVQYRVLADSLNPVPGFAEQLVGIAKGQSKEFTLSFPAEHENKQIAGKTFQFKATATEIKEKNLPPLDDEFAKGVGDGYESLAALREKNEKDLRERAEAAAKAEYQDKALQEMVKISKLEYPPVLVEQEIEHMMVDQEEQLKRNRISMEQYLRAIGKNRDEARQDLRPAAEERLKRSLALSRFIEVEELKVAEAEIKAESDAISQGAGEQSAQVRQALESEESRKSLERILLQRKALERLASMAAGEAVAVGQQTSQKNS